VGIGHRRWQEGALSLSASDSLALAASTADKETVSMAKTTTRYGESSVGSNETVAIARCTGEISYVRRIRM
jgi:hypothetical protein